MNESQKREAKTRFDERKNIGRLYPCKIWREAIWLLNLVDFSMNVIIVKNLLYFTAILTGMLYLDVIKCIKGCSV